MPPTTTTPTCVSAERTHVDETFKRIFSNSGMIGVVIFDHVARVLKARGSKTINEADFIATWSAFIERVDSFKGLKISKKKNSSAPCSPSPSSATENDDEDEKNDSIRCIRVRFEENELIIAPGGDFSLCISQS